MNDCVWDYIGICETTKCYQCKKYISRNSDGGSTIREAYSRDVKEALKPVKKMYKQMFAILYDENNKEEK